MVFMVLEQHILFGTIRLIGKKMCSLLEVSLRSAKQEDIPFSRMHLFFILSSHCTLLRLID